MASFFILLLLGATLVGHIALWTLFYNRLHASGIPSRIIPRIEKLVVVVMLGSLSVPIAWLMQFVLDWPSPLAGGLLGGPFGRVWMVACCGMFAYVSLAWAVRRFGNSDGGLLLSNETRLLDVEKALGFRPIGDRRTRWQSRIPGNQILHVSLQSKRIVVRDLPNELDGLRIAQISDLHMTGQLQREFFDLAIEHTNQFGAELVVVTGDLVDRAACIDWLPGTLGQLASHYGTFALLGNHDQRLADVGRLRATLTSCGIVDLGGKAIVKQIRGVDILLAGNECPWFPPAPTLPKFTKLERPFSILLSHSPDTLPWARQQQFNLMLAGHTHGGQIRFPLIGPVVCPSRFGVRYASGLFDVRPTLLHVSRGLSGVHTLRFNCPPEITLLELRCP